MIALGVVLLAVGITVLVLAATFTVTVSGARMQCVGG